jgi:hypothetical protein
MYDMMLLHKALFEYTPKIFEKENINKISMNEDNTVFITFNDGSMEVLDNALNIEDIKILI